MRIIDLASRALARRSHAAESLKSWGQVLHDDDLAQAIVDRVLERGRLLRLDGPSVRTKHLPLDYEEAAASEDQPAKVSGIDRQEFPEPTSLLDERAHRRHATGMAAQSPKVRAVLELIAEMSDDERGQLRETLSKAIAAPAEWHAAWNDELGRRIAQVERGEARLLTEEEFFADEEPAR